MIFLYSLCLLSFFIFLINVSCMKYVLGLMLIDFFLVSG